MSIFASLALLVLHKTWALHTPQLWAEDGSIFLNDAEVSGVASLFHSYQGYLLFIPRLTALLWDAALDVRWWPLAYNATALLAYGVVFTRIASSRMTVPHKPWLILAFGLAAQTGETLLNITNVQWVSAFFLILQLLMQPATRPWQLVIDGILLVLAGLTGPFSAALLPLFAWQAWQHRDRTRITALAIVGMCAATQAWFLIRSPGVPPIPRPATFSLMNYLAVLGDRIVAWPLFGRHVATTLPPLALALLGTCLFLWVLGRVILTAQRRGPALVVLAVFACLVAAISFRARPDGWTAHDVDNGDRYYFIPRVLFIWLLILEFSASAAWSSTLARVLCVIGALLELPDHRIPAPPDYHWAQNCDPIRRGVPAQIRTLPRDWILQYPGRQR